jgi:ABC-type Fe3+ transport system permease subunit
MASTLAVALFILIFYFDFLLAAVSKESLLFVLCGKQCRACSFLYRGLPAQLQQIEPSAILAAKTSNCWPITPTQESIENL